MDTLFQTLRAGARFKRPRAQQQPQHQQPGWGGAADAGGGALTHAASKVPDFFGQHTHHQQQPQQQPRRLESEQQSEKKKREQHAKGVQGSGGGRQGHKVDAGGNKRRRGDGASDDDAAERSDEQEDFRSDDDDDVGAPLLFKPTSKKAAGAGGMGVGGGGGGSQQGKGGKQKRKRGVGGGDEGGDEEVEGRGIQENSRHEEEEMRAFRRRMRIHVHGDDVPPALAAFEDMKGDSDVLRVVLRNIEAGNRWTEPTPIQMQAIPAMATGRDLFASAPTGSGKTAAFVLPTILRLASDNQKGGGPRGLLLAPTRELAAQIHREVERLLTGTKRLKACLLSKALAATGKASGAKRALGAYDIMVATPMRLLSVLREGTVDLSHVQVVVLDEADKLFELGRDRGNDDEDATSAANDRSFLAQIDEILAACSHPKVQRALFSATPPPSVEDLASTVLRDPYIKVWIGKHAMAGAETIEQRLKFVGREEGKLVAMRQLIREGLRPPVLVFLQSKERARELFHELVYDGIRVDVMHAERTPEQRDALVRKFRSGEIWVLICTDLMARGVDFKAVNMVINYDLPQSAVAYIHRIGRTGRAGRKGLAVTLFTEADMAHMRPIANVVKLSGSQVPEWMLAMKKESSKDRRRLEVSAPKRHRVSTVPGYDKTKAHNKRRAVERSSGSGDVTSKHGSTSVASESEGGHERNNKKGKRRKKGAQGGQGGNRAEIERRKDGV